MDPLLSELVLQRKLHLPRRSGIAGREARVCNNAKGIAAHLRRPSRLSEIGVIEHVKDFPTEFDHLPFAQPGAFDQGQITGVKTWPNYHVPAHTPEVVDSLITDSDDR